MLETFPWHSDQWRLLNSTITQNKLHHALLLTGPEGIGLSQFSSQLAAALLCHQPAAKRMCGACKSCVLFNAGNHPDLMSLEPEEPGGQIKVALVRDLIEFMQRTNQYGRKKIAIIEPAEAMNRNSANSLLKTLEEPPPDSLFILLTHRPGQMLVTIRSRCQRISFPPSYAASTVEWLRQTVANEQVNIAGILQLAHGAPFKALQLAEQDVAAKHRVIVQDLAAACRLDTDIVRIAESWQNIGAEKVLEWLMEIFRQMIRVKLAPGAAAALAPYFQVLADRLDLPHLISCYDKVASQYRDLAGPYHLNVQSLLEEMIIYWQSLNNTIEGGTH
jgi:DNA polymerase-3 subunit delta'